MSTWSLVSSGYEHVKQLMQPCELAIISTLDSASFYLCSSTSHSDVVQSCFGKWYWHCCTSYIQNQIVFVCCENFNRVLCANALSPIPANPIPKVVLACCQDKFNRMGRIGQSWFTAVLPGNIWPNNCILDNIRTYETRKEIAKGQVLKKSHS